MGAAAVWPPHPPCFRTALVAPAGDRMKSTLHIRTTGFYCKACPLVVEKALRSVPGVADVMSVRTMGLTSVMYDPETVDADHLCERIRSAGFGAEVYCPRSPEHSNDPDDTNDCSGRGL